jgi:hypothetical protein
MSRRFAFDARATMAAIATRRAGSAVAVPAVPAVLNQRQPQKPPKPPPPGAELVLTRPTAFRGGEPIDMSAIEQRAALAADNAPAPISTPGSDYTVPAAFVGRWGRAYSHGVRQLVGRRLAGLLRRTGGNRRVRRRSAAPGGRGRCLRLLRLRVAQPKSGALVVRQTAFTAARPSKATTRCCRSEPNEPATLGCIRTAGRVGPPPG